MASCVISNAAILLLHFILFFSNRLVAIETQGTPLAAQGSQGSPLTTYIIHVEPPPPHLRADPKDREAWHRSFLPVHLVDSGEDRLLYSYEHVINGFAARLTEEELAVVREMDGFLAAQPDKLIPLQTTHSPEYLKLQASGVWNVSNYGEGVIIGVLDGGIDPDHPSFHCDLPSPPDTWKGKCDFEPNRCNKKIIGARSFTSGLRAMHAQGLAGEISQGETPFDTQGHGTHVASIAAGCSVQNAADQNGQAQGTAVGVAPRAYLSVYKVCGLHDCPSTDVLAGLDAAINDSVHVVSLSIGTPNFGLLTDDAVVIGGFKAMEKGIFVSCAAGNHGPESETLANDVPWLLTVGATTMDRSIRTTVRLGNGLEFDGESLTQTPSDRPAQHPLVSCGRCWRNNLVNVRGKAVLCEYEPKVGAKNQGFNVLTTGGKAMILGNTAKEGNTTQAEADLLPASRVSFYANSAIKEYISSDSSPTAAVISKGTVTGGPFTPAVASSSSRGPSLTSPGIVKPDIVAPGINILAAWPAPVEAPDARPRFKIMSGTSMATPHVSGVAALIKSAHPTWSPAAIRSALMTSAIQVGSAGKRIEDHLGRPASLFDMGAGEVNARGAVDINVVHEVSPRDYIAYLCGGGHSNFLVSTIAGRAVDCSSVASIKEDELNYPTFRISLSAANHFTREVTRALTNLGSTRTTCTALRPTFVEIFATVGPTTLEFSPGEKKQYTVAFRRRVRKKTGTLVSGQLGWSCDDGTILRNAVMVSYD